MYYCHQTSLLEEGPAVDETKYLPRLVGGRGSLDIVLQCIRTQQVHGFLTGCNNSWRWASLCLICKVYIMFMNCQMRREDIYYTTQIFHQSDAATAIRERYSLNPSDWQICGCGIGYLQIVTVTMKIDAIASGACKLHFLDNLAAYYNSPQFLTSSPVLQHQRSPAGMYTPRHWLPIHDSRRPAT